MKKILHFVSKYRVAVGACSLMAAFGFGWWILANPGTTTIGDDTTIGNNLYVTGSVGIGTTAPESNLEVRADSTTLGGTLTVANSGLASGASSALDFRTNAIGSTYPNVRLQALDSSDWSSHLLFLTKTPGASANSLAERMRITSSGNVGIGTTSPSYKLHVVGDIYASGNITCGGSCGGGGGGYWILNGSSLYPSSTSYNVGIGTTNPTLAPLQTSGMVGNTSAVFGSNTTGVGLMAAYPAIGFNEYYNAGNKGIAAGYTGVIGLNPSAGNMYFMVGGNAGSAGAPVTDSTAMTILSTGNVGIGTTSPGAKLQVKGAEFSSSLYVNPIANSFGVYGSSIGLDFDARSMGNSYWAGGSIAYGGEDAAYAGYFWFDENERFSKTSAGVPGSPTMILRGGKVGIGTTSPGTKLDVAQGEDGSGAEKAIRISRPAYSKSCDLFIGTSCPSATAIASSNSWVLCLRCQ